LSPLAETQRDFLQAVLDGNGDAAARLGLRGKISVADVIRLHRDTVLGALTTSLQLSFPTVDQLVGRAFFDQAALVFVERAPPQAANLSAYGEGLPDFLAAYEPAAALPYLADVARLDWLIANTHLGPDETRRRDLPIDAFSSLSVPAGLSVLALDHPATEIRDTLEDGDLALLGTIDMTPRRRFVAVWRRGETAVSRGLAPPAGLFLAALLNGRDGDDALSAALAAASEADVLSAIQSDIFAASFARLTLSTQETT
jgi:Putative DNA-binding domain